LRKLYIAALCSAAVWLSACSDVNDVKQMVSDTYENATQIVGDTVDSVKLPDPKEIDSVSTDKFVYCQLGVDAQICYDQMLDCILRFEESATLSTTDPDMIEQAFEAIFADYGGLFWADGYSYKTYYRGDNVVGITFSPKYTMTKEERDDYQSQVDATVEAWLSQLPEGAGDYEKAKFVFETLIDRVDYDTQSPNNQNILSVFLGNATVCQGYADATSVLLSQLGIPSTIISGRANNEAHAWNLVVLDGEYYFIDTTWGNSRYTDAATNSVKHVNYAYLNVTSEELLGNHTVLSTFEIPECTATANNYYRHEGLYFDTVDVNAIGQIFAEGYYGGADSSTVKMADPALYMQMKQYFITDGHIADYCSGIRSVTYLESEETNVLTIEW
ncbi:MAG: hypothetical protein IJT32_01505, partial [Lachnospiraceae bacterium]|nr:hypothetical protein [Lachnospiraceae bacterium]